ncbi:MAG: IS21 family transposase [Deltaproteobacteria bacterium]|nr:IS21 family transposase [Deltaproteobacteria bacterium]
MWEILNVLRRIGRGETKAAVARVTGHRRKTIRRYVATALELGWKPGLEAPTEQLAIEVFERLRPGPGAGRSGEVERLLLPYRDRITQWLKPGRDGYKRGLRLSKVHRLLAREGVEVAYSSLHRFAVKYCGFWDRRRVTVRVAESEPGEVAEVDFGRLGLVPNPETGRNRVVHALIVTLVQSRHQYVHVTHSQKLEDLIGGLEDAFAFFAGVPRRLILDNLHAAITKPDVYDPIFARTFEEYATYRGFIIDAARVRHAKGKPHVERNVSYVRDSFFRGERWLNIEHVQREAVRWCLQTAGLRIHGTTRKRPLAVFENQERARLLPLEKERFDPPHWGKCKVHPDHHISFQKALYSLPTRYIGQTVWVRADSKLVRIYVAGKLVNTHERQPPGGRSTNYSDYPQELAPYARRDPDRMIREAKQHGTHLGRFMAALLAGSFPWAKLRQAQKLQRLGHKYGWRRVDQACRRALAFELINVKRVEQILRADLDRSDMPGDPRSETKVVQFPLRFARPAESFAHQPSTGDDK